LPDIWDDFVWPQSFYLLSQINCADLTKYDVLNRLPKTGILYFFLSEEHNNGLVKYYDGDLSKLKPFEDEWGNSPTPRFTEDQLEFSRSLADESYRFLLGSPDCMNDPSPRYNESPNRWQLLMQTPYYTGDLLYFIDKKDLANRDFSNIWTEIVYD
jgi:uncharacterized protein YwqG